MSWGGHRVAQHKGHDPGEQQRTPFFRLLFKGRKTYQNGVFRFFMVILALTDLLNSVPLIYHVRLRPNVLFSTQMEIHCLLRLSSDTI
jgi:hypothetical protein